MSNTLITRVYGDFRGCDFRGEDVDITRSPNSLNMWKDYKDITCIKTRPKMEEIEKFGGTVWGIYFFNVKDKEIMIVHSGTKLYKIDAGERTEIFDGANNGNSNAFIYDNVWYFKDGKNYLKYDGETIEEVVGYIPTTSIARAPGGGGQIYEDVNLLSSRRINTFLADGVGTEFYLDAENIDTDFPPIVKVNDKLAKNYVVNYEEGKIIFGSPPSVPLTDGQDNVSVEFSKTVEGYKEKIYNCTLLQIFDNRVFFSGNPNYPNTVFHCSLNDPSYCSDLDYYNEGLDDALVTGLVAGNNALWVFKESSNANTSVFYHTPTIDDEYGKIYPSVHSSVSTGCVGGAINFNDDIVFFSERGMEGISGDITTEQVLGHRSTLIDRKLLVEKNYKDMKLAEWEGYLLIFIDNKVYLADSRAMFTNGNHVEYDFFYWELTENIKCTCVKDGVLYLGTKDRIYTLTDNESDVVSYWTTPKDKFNYVHKFKTTNKRGCTVEALGDISIYAKTEKSDFELIGTYENVTDYLVSRIKKKKFKDLQLRFYSDKRFRLETASLEVFVGAYIKR